MIKKAINILKNPLRIPLILILKLPYFNFIRDTTDYQCPNSFSYWFFQKVLNLGGNKDVYWPVHFSSKVVRYKNIIAGIDTSPGMMPGCYIQGHGKVFIGDYTQIASNVIIISANHDIYDTRKHIPKEVKLGKYCWIGAGAKIMPGVTLGDWTIVGAGAVVTKSFPDGFCVLGGVPAQIIKNLDREKCIPFENKIKYNGYIRSDRFEGYRKKYLNV